MTSVIIPVYNAASHLEKVLRHTLRLKGSFEVIVVDGGSTDHSISIIQSFPQVKLYCAPKGRRLQMNKGANHAKGEVLLFLHADTYLPANGINEISELMKELNCTGGSFSLKFDYDHWMLKLYSTCSKINHSLFTYGDQGIYCRASIFHEIGGFMEIPIMEDAEIQFSCGNPETSSNFPKPSPLQPIDSLKMELYGKCWWIWDSSFYTDWVLRLIG